MLIPKRLFQEKCRGREQSEKWSCEGPRLVKVSHLLQSLSWKEFRLLYQCEGSTLCEFNDFRELLLEKLKCLLATLTLLELLAL